MDALADTPNNTDSSVLLYKVEKDCGASLDQVSDEPKTSSGKEKICLTCGILGATESTFTRVGKAKANPEPLINLFCCIIKKSLLEVQLYSDAVCEKCFRSFELVARLQHRLSEVCRDIIKGFNHALKIFAKSGSSLQYEENKCPLVSNDTDLSSHDNGVIAKALSLASSKRKEKSNNTKTERKFQCNVCGKAFRAYSHKVEHMVVHTQEKSFKCDKCGFLSTTKSNLRRHMQQHTHEHICDICGKKLCSKFSLKEHMVVHSNCRPYKCDYCDKSFLRQRERKIHQRNHLVDSEPFECEICHKRFVLKSRLTRHMFVHSTEKQYVCTVCDKKFARKDDLQCHERIHSGDRPYACKECDKCFRFKSNFRSHMKCHTKESKLYHCICCVMSFPTEAKYNNHLKTSNHKRKSCEAVQTLEEADCAPHRFEFGKKKVVDEVPTGEQFYCSVCCITFDSFSQYSQHTCHSHVDQGVIPQTNESGVLISTLESNNILGLPLEQFTVTNESVNMAVSMGGEETALQISVIQNTASGVHPLTLGNKSTSTVSDNPYSAVLNVVPDSENIGAITGSENLCAISGSENIVISSSENNTGNTVSDMDPSIETATVSNTVIHENAENLFKISDWDMNSYCQKMKV